MTMDGFAYDEELRSPQPGEPDHPADPSDPQDDDEEATPRPTSSRWTDSIRNRLFKARTLIISGEVNQKLASEVIGQLLALDAESDDVITVFINSQGGHVESGDTIHDMI